jgi:YD repeat-containing protein
MTFSKAIETLRQERLPTKREKANPGRSYLSRIGGNVTAGCLKKLGLALMVGFAGVVNAQTPSMSLIPIADHYTNQTACPNGGKLDYFYYSSDVPAMRGKTWCGAAAAWVNNANATDTQTWRLPYELESCQDGVAWYYSHALGGSSRHYSPAHAYIGMVCTPVPAVPPETEKSSQKCDRDGLQAGNPILPATGEKVLSQPDINGQGADALSLARHYRSSWAGVSGRDLAVNPGLSQAWSHSHAVSIKWEGVAGTANSVARVIFGDGSVRAFAWDVGSSSWSAGNSADSLTANTAGLLYKRQDDDSQWQFDTAGKLLTVTQRNGWTTTYTYSTTSTPANIAPVPGLLLAVSNQFGRTLSFAYNVNIQLISVAASDGQLTSYTYDGTTDASRLIGVTYPGLTGGTVSKTYLYENITFPQLLTGINDELGARLATYAYDAQGRGISTQHAGGADLHTVSYGAAGVATVTDPLGTQRTYNYSTNKGKLAVTGADKASGSGNSSAASRVQDANGFVTQETDFLGVSTMYTWDINRRLPLTTTQAATLPEARTTSTQWHPSFRLPVLVTEAGRTIAYTYDTQGNKLSQTVTDTATSVARTTSWTYNPQGLLATETTNGVVTQIYAYYGTTSFTGTAPNEVGHTAGDLQSTTNAVGHVTQFTLYDRAGRVRQMVDPKGVATDTAYTPRGWVSSTSVTPPGGTARTTSYSYDNAGQLTGVVMPDTTTMSYSYDAAHRLKGVTDAKGNTVAYTLDAMGNQVGEQVKDPSGNLQRNITRVYDALNRVQQVTGASN